MSSGLTMSGIDGVREMLSESAAVQAWLGVATAAAALAKIYTHWLPDEDPDDDDVTLAEREALRPWICVMAGGGYQMVSSGLFSQGRNYVGARVMYERVADDDADERVDFTAFHDEVDGMNQGVMENQDHASIVDITQAPDGQPMKYAESKHYPRETGRPRPLVVFGACFDMALGGAG